MENLLTANGTLIVFCAQCGQMLIDNGTSTVDGMVCSDCLRHYVKCCNCQDLWHENNIITDNDNNIWCEDCYNEHFSDCAQCGETCYNEDMIWIDSTREHVCENCFNELYFTCEDCNEVFHNNNSFRAFSRFYCENCYNERFTNCSSCGDTIERDNAYFTESGDGPFCEECYQDDYGNCNGLIQGHNYKPSPNFFTNSKSKTNIFFGFELEVELPSKQNRYDAAQEMLEVINSDYQIFYLKEDGSIKHGFEIVSHPMTWDFIRADSFQNTLSELEQHCEDNGIKSHDTTTCGFHIHASKNYFSTLHIFKLLSFVFNESNFYSVLLPVSQRSEKSFNHWATIYDSGQTIIEKTKDKRTDNRYTALNLTKKTIEARIFRGNIRKDRILKNLEFYKALIDYTEQAPIKTASDKNSFLSFVQKNKKLYSALDNFLSEKNLY